ncbi:hypothetical protein MUK42_19113 [Musa troglodytarum]|uniref:Uncharacterized protein n=1 Tax=Musa troglodytarum TaxID=320322 RepID=A0A9E7EV94_9LILI|nr:hypothetical protein MUK42_19113 [Musa troglodytarum]URD82457.1 hypothetical protein MUK42_19113 [Musa troglodytarum]URD82458.1 hypothetical protein MUK42_19113 [Musa troglodytarum]
MGQKMFIMTSLSLKHVEGFLSEAVFELAYLSCRRLVKWMFVRISLWEHIPQHCPTVVDQIVPQNLLEQRHPIYTKFALVSSVALKQMVNAASFIFDVRQFVVSPALHLLSKIFRLGYCAACSQDG